MTAALENKALMEKREGLQTGIGQTSRKTEQVLKNL